MVIYLTGNQPVVTTTVPVAAAPFSLFCLKRTTVDEDIQKIQEVYRSYS